MGTILCLLLASHELKHQLSLDLFGLFIEGQWAAREGALLTPLSSAPSSLGSPSMPSFSGLNSPPSLVFPAAQTPGKSVILRGGSGKQPLLSPGNKMMSKFLSQWRKENAEVYLWVVAQPPLAWGDILILS